MVERKRNPSPEGEGRVRGHPPTVGGSLADGVYPVAAKVQEHGQSSYTDSLVV
jgi:hypothetical protein